MEEFMNYIDNHFVAYESVKESNESDKFFMEKVPQEEISDCIKQKYEIVYNKTVCEFHDDSSIMIIEATFNNRQKFMYFKLYFSDMSKWNEKSYYKIEFSYYRYNYCVEQHDYSTGFCKFGEQPFESDTDSTVSDKSYDQYAELDFGNYWPNDSIYFANVGNAYEFLDKYEGSQKFGNVFSKISGFYKYIDDIEIYYDTEENYVLFNPKKIKTKKIIVSQWSGVGISGLNQDIIDNIVRIHNDQYNDNKTVKEILKHYKIDDDAYSDLDSDSNLNTKELKDSKDPKEYDYSGPRDDLIVIKAIEMYQNSQKAQKNNKEKYNRQTVHIVEIPEDASYIFGDHNDTEIVIIMKKVY